MATTLKFIKRNDGLTDNLKPNGFARIGCDGPQNTPGKPGMTYYFIDYDPSNSYYKELVLKRLEYNYVLTTNNSNKLIGRNYRIGDLIMSKDKNIYQITNPESNSNYKFDIKYIGKIFPRKPFSSESLTIPFIGVELNGYKKIVERCVVPVNRSFDFDTPENSNRFIFKSNMIKGFGSLVVTVSNKNQSASGTVNIQQGTGLAATNIAISNCVHSIIQGNSFLSTIVDSSTNYGILLEGSRNDWPEIKITQNPVFFDYACYHETQNPYISDANHIPNTSLYRTYDSSHSASFEEAYRGLYGISFRPSIRFDTTTNKDVLKHYDFYLRIYIKNQKTIQSGAYGLASGVSDNFTSPNIPMDPVLSTSDNQFVFYKCLEMKLFNIDQNGVHYNDELNIDETVYTDSSNYLYFISDMAADKLHPSGNNINVSYLPPEENVGTGANIVANLSRFMTGIKYWAGINYNTNTFDDTVSPYYTVTQDLDINVSKADYLGFTSLFKYDSYIKSHSIVQYSKRYDSSYSSFPVNYRGGESTYFSGMTIPVLAKSYFASNGTYPIYRTLADYNGTYSSYVTNIMSTNKNVCVVDDIMRNSSNPNDVDLAFAAVDRREAAVMNYVTDKIDDFIFSQDNEYEIVCVSKDSASGVHIGDTKILKIDRSKITKS